MAAIVNARDALLQAPGVVRLLATDLEDPLSMFSAVKSWDFRNSLEGWTISGAGNVLRADSFDVSSSGSDPQINSPALTINGGFYDKVRARVRRKGGTGWQGSLYYKTPDRQTFEELFTKQVTDATVNGNWVVLEWDMGDSVNWTTKTITQIRLDLGASVSDVFEIDWISVGRYGPVSLSDLGYTGALNATYGADWATNVNGAGTVNQAISDAASTASAAASNADAALTRLGSMSDDAVIDRTEKPEIVKEWKVVTDERAGIQARADEMGVSRVAYDAAYSALSTYLGTLAYTDYTKDNAVVRPTFNTNWATLYTQRQLLLNAIVGASAKNVFAPTRTWDFATDAEGWIGESSTATIAQGTNSIIITSTSTDPRLGSASGLALVGSQNDKWRMRLRRTAGTGWQGCIYYTTTAGPNALHGSSSSHQKTIATDPTIGGAWTIMEWDMAALTAGGTDYVLSTIGQVRFDLGASASDVFEIDWITVGKHGPAISAIDLAAAANTASWGSVSGKPLDSDIMNSELDPKFAGLDTPYLRWDFGTSAEGFTANTATLTYDGTDGTLLWTPTGSNPLLSKGIPAASKFNGKDYTKVRARVKRVSGTGPWEGNLYYGAAGPVATHGAVSTAYAKVAQPANPDDWNILEWDMTKLEAGGTDWLDNIIDMIRIDLVSSNSPASSWKVDWVAIGKFNTGVSPTEVKGIQADLATLTTNFNSTNDRNNAAITAPTIVTDGNAVDHTIRTDGSADISFEWAWAGNEGDIDGFLVYVFQQSATGAYTFGTTPAAETVFTVPANKRAFILTGAAANLYTTFGVQAYRSVDKDVNSAGVIKSTLVKPSATAENPYQPASSVAFAGNITGTLNGTAVATVVTNAADGGAAYNAITNPTTGLASKLTNGDNILKGIQTASTLYAGGFRAGTLTWNAAGQRTGGYGVGITPAGFIGYRQDGSKSVVIDVANGEFGLYAKDGSVILATGSSLQQQTRSNPNLCCRFSSWEQRYNATPGYSSSDVSLTNGTYLYLSDDGEYNGAVSLPLNIQANTMYTVSFDAYVQNGDGRVLNVDVFGGGIDTVGMSVALTQSWRHFKFTEIMPGVANAENLGRLRMFASATFSDSKKGIVVANVKVEIGPNETPWCESVITPGNVAEYVAPNSIGNTQIGGDLFSTNWNGYTDTRGAGWLMARNGVLYCHSLRARGSITGGDYSPDYPWNWVEGDRADGTKKQGFSLHDGGLLLGNPSRGGYFQATSSGEIYSPFLNVNSAGLKVKGEVSGSVIRTSVMALESARLLTPWNRLAPFIVYDTGMTFNTSQRSMSVTLMGFRGPAEGGEYVYDSKRFSSFKKDVFLEAILDGEGGMETLIFEAMYHDNGGWGEIARVRASTDYRSGFALAIRYTPADSGWDRIAFRCRTTESHTLSIIFKVMVYNFNESGNAPYSTSGVSSGDGGGSSGTTPPAENWCVDYETCRFSDGSYVRDVKVNDLVEVWNDDADNPLIELAPAQQVRFGTEQSYLMRTESGVEIIQSRSTPMSLRDGGIKTTNQMLGEDVLVNRKGDLKWERVVYLEDVGERRVVKLALGDRMYFAGTDPKATIATHNIVQQYKP